MSTAAGTVEVMMTSGGSATALESLQNYKTGVGEDKEDILNSGL